MPTLSVIIPTHKRALILQNTIKCLEQQTASDDIEVIVVSDGHDEKTEALFQKTSWKVPVRFFEIKKSQQGSARNKGLEEATGDYVLFIGDDMLLFPDACRQHIKDHKRINEITGGKKQVAVLGYTTWDPAVGITPVMKWLETSGWQFGYPKIQQYSGTYLPEEIQHLFCYTINISLPIVVAKDHIFRDDLTMYGWEDIEWGMRLRSSDIRLYYDPLARGLHHHKITKSESLRRMHTLGKSIVAAKQKAPGLDRLPTGKKRLLYIIASLLPTMAGKHRKAFLNGIKQGEKEMGND